MADTDLPQCPVCGADIANYTPEDDKLLEYWTFYCGAEVSKEEGKFVDADHCRDALPNALRKLNEKNLSAAQ